MKKKFRTTLFGFRKKDVNAYIDHLLQAFDEKISNKEKEIQQIQKQLEEINGKYQSLKEKENDIKREKERISQAFIDAKQASDHMVEQAKIEAKKEIEDLEEYAEQEREKIVDIKKELKYLKESAKSALSRYEDALNNIMEEATQDHSDSEQNDH